MKVASILVAGLSGWRMRPSGRMLRRNSVALESPALSAIPSGPVERVAINRFSSPPMGAQRAFQRGEMWNVQQPWSGKDAIVLSSCFLCGVAYVIYITHIVRVGVTFKDNSIISYPSTSLLSSISYPKTCEGGERKPARVFSVKPARKMISNIDYPIISHLSNMPTFFWAKTRQIRGADTPRGRNVPGKEAGQRQTKWHTVWCAISICHTWPRR